MTNIFALQITQKVTIFCYFEQHFELRAIASIFSTGTVALCNLGANHIFIPCLQDKKQSLNEEL